jgi:probable HAF family extracellular repeat protein
VDGEATELNGVGGHQTTALAVNNRGQAVGGSTDAADRRHAVLWEPDGTLVDLDPQGADSLATGINRRGTVAGMARAPSGGLHVVIWQDGVMTFVGDLGGGFGLPVRGSPTDRGVVVGTGGDSSGVERAFRWRKGTTESLPTLPSVPPHADSRADAVNGRGDVVGLTEEGPSFLWTRTGVSIIPDLGGGFVGPLAINNRRQIVGQAVTADGEPRAFLAEGDVIVDLGTLGGPRSEAVALNARGQIVGSARLGDDSPETHAVLWDDGEIIDLGTLGGDSSAAQDINRRGQIVGWSTDEEGVVHAVMWTVEP